MDSAGFRELLMAEIDSVYRMAMHLSRRPDDAADLVQETYYRAIRAEATFKLGEKGVRPWLFKILHNVFFTKVQRGKRERTFGDDLPEAALGGTLGEVDEPPPAWDLASLDWEQVDDRLKAAIFELPAHYRAPLLLWGVEGMKYREIADVLDVPLGTVMSRLHRARITLTEKLADLAAEHGLDRAAAGDAVKAAE